jgi:hypothetical protein
MCRSWARTRRRPQHSNFLQMAEMTKLMGVRLVGNASMATGSTFGLELIHELGAASAAPRPAPATRMAFIGSPIQKSYREIKT